MRLLIDALGAPTTSGGMRLHATELITAWSSSFPDDDVLVVGGAWTRQLPLGRRMRRVVWPNDNAIVRAIGQQLLVPALYRLTGRTRLLATNSMISPLVPASRSTVVAHDWRHLRRPKEFSAFQRLYRRNWLRSARRAAHVVTVSEKTARETRGLVDPRRVVVVENGRDHAAQWAPESLRRPSGAGERSFVLTYGQHTNKRPELVVRAMGLPEAPPDLDVVVLGLQEDSSAALAGLAADLGIRERFVPLGYVDEAEYRWLASNAAVIALVSSDEGFGLPLAEAAALGVPSVVAEDNGVADLFADTAEVAEATPASVLAAVVRARGRDRTGGAAGGSTWASVVDSLRSVILGTR